MRLRLTAHSLAGLRGPAPEDGQPDEMRLRLRHRAAELAGFYGEIAAEVGHAGHVTALRRQGRDGARAWRTVRLWPVLRLWLMMRPRLTVRRPMVPARRLTGAAAHVRRPRPTLRRGRTAPPRETWPRRKTWRWPNACSRRTPPPQRTPRSQRASPPGWTPPDRASTTAGGAAAYGRPHLLYVHEHLHHLQSRLATIGGPALRMAEVRQRPWWR